MRELHHDPSRFAMNLPPVGVEHPTVSGTSRGIGETV